MDPLGAKRKMLGARLAAWPTCLYPSCRSLGLLHPCMSKQGMTLGHGEGAKAVGL